MRILKNRHYVRFFDFEDNPNIEDVYKGVDLYNDFKCELIIAVGGGSVIDMAKLIKYFYKKDKPFINYFESKILKNENPSLIVLPTTAGTGSEATQFAVVYVESNKFSISDRFLLPEYVFIVPKFHLSQSSYQKAVSGIDALAQAIESYWSLNSTKESKESSIDALKLIIPNLPSVINNNYDLTTHKKMAKGAFLAGKAINIAKTTAPHAFSYYLTKRFNLPHGHAVGLFLPSFICYNAYYNCDLKNNTIDLNNLFKILHELLPSKGTSRIDLRIYEDRKSVV